VAHSCNPSYSGGRDQETHGSKPDQANGSPDPILKKLHKKGLMEWLKAKDPEFKPQYHTHTKKKNLKKKVLKCRKRTCPQRVQLVETDCQTLKEARAGRLLCPGDPHLMLPPPTTLLLL
jgi:hypothetical protein